MLAVYKPSMQTIVLPKAFQKKYVRILQIHSLYIELYTTITAVIHFLIFFELFVF